MKSILVLLASIVLVSACKTTATLDKKSILSKNIYIDTTWTKDNGPVTISGNRWVMGPAKLKIEKGTTVLFKRGSYLNVEGAIIVNGTPEEPVIFKAEGDSTSHKYWEHINLKGKRNQSIIRFATFKNSSAALFIETDKVQIRNCKFINNTHGIYIKNASPKISGSYFTKNKTALISFGKNSGEIIRNKFVNNIDIAISAHDSFSARIKKNIFKRNKFGITLRYTNSSNESMKPEITFNDFKNNRYKNLHLSNFPEEFSLEATSNYWGHKSKLKIKGSVVTDPHLLTPQFQETLK